MNGYELSRSFFDWCFNNPEKVKPNHVALYFFAIEHCNRLGWKSKFGLPTTMTKEAIGIRSYNTYINALNDLVEWGFIRLIEKSKNQYSSNIIALSNFDKAHNKALDKALIKHGSKQSESTGESIGSIVKQDNKEPINKEQRTKPDLAKFLDYCSDLCLETNKDFNGLRFTFESKFRAWVEDGWKDGNGKIIKNWKTKIRNTLPYLKSINQNNGQQATDSFRKTHEALGGSKLQ